MKRMVPMGIFGAVVAMAACGHDRATGAGGSPSMTGSSSTGASTAATSSASSTGGPVEACPKQHVLSGASGEIIVCDEAFTSAPRVHLPPVEPAADGRPSVDFMAMRGCQDFVDRDGQVHELAGGSPPLCQGSGGSADPDTLGHAFAVYRTTLDGDGRVTSYARWAVIDERNMFTPFTGQAIDGKIAAAMSGGGFALDTSIPLRITLGMPEVATLEADGTTSYRLPGTIESMSDSVTASDGSCTKALQSVVNAPFIAEYGTDAISLAVYRVPSMHAPGDDEVVVEYFVSGTSKGTCMGRAWWIGPEALIGPGSGDPTTLHCFGHGTPGSIPNIDLDLAHGGGQPCTP